jgi:hypothetical protein
VAALPRDRAQKRSWGHFPFNSENLFREKHEVPTQMELSAYANLTFEAPDEIKFPSLGMAKRAVAAGGTMAAGSRLWSTTDRDINPPGQKIDLWIGLVQLLESPSWVGQR